MGSIERVFEADKAREPDYESVTLTPKQIAAGKHRRWVGGHWDTDHGENQLKYLVEQGLKPHHKFLDIGCGSFRAGRFFIDYLEPGNYYGIDANQSVMQAGYDVELTDALRAKLPVTNLRATDRFNVDFGAQFDMALAQSVFTHIDLNKIRLCLYRLALAMKVGGSFYATFFERPADYPLDEVWQTKRGAPKYQERNCFWYYRRDMKWVARAAPWKFQYVGQWGHPAGQRMVRYRRQKAPSVARKGE